MSKEQENLREKFIKETKSKLWAEDINEDVGFSDKYVEWLEKQLLIPFVVKRFFAINKKEMTEEEKDLKRRRNHYPFG